MNTVNLKFINFLTKEGKKSKAFSIFRKTILILSKKMQESTKLFPVVSKSAAKFSNELDLENLPLVILPKISHNLKVSSDSTQIEFPVLRQPEIFLDKRKLTSLLSRENFLLFKLSNRSLNSSPAVSTYFSKKNENEKIKLLNPSLNQGVQSIFCQSIENVKPIFEVKRIRIAGSTQQIPSLVPFQRQESLAIRWIIQAAKDRKKKSDKIHFEECLALEIIEVFKKQGSARHKRDELHKIAEANRAYSHYRWW